MATAQAIHEPKLDFHRIMEGWGAENNQSQNHSPIDRKRHLIAIANRLADNHLPIATATENKELNLVYQNNKDPLGDVFPQHSPKFDNPIEA